MLSRPRNPPAKTLRPWGSLRFTHQLKFSIRPWKERSRNLHVRPAEAPSDLVEKQRRPGVHRRIDVAEVPLVRGNLSVGMRVQASQHQQELILREVEVDERQAERVKRQVPCGVPRVLPLVGHRDDVAVQHVEPLGVAHARARRRRGADAPCARPAICRDRSSSTASTTTCPRATGDECVRWSSVSDFGVTLA